MTLKQRLSGHKAASFASQRRDGQAIQAYFLGLRSGLGFRTQIQLGPFSAQNTITSPRRAPGTGVLDLEALHGLTKGQKVGGGLERPQP